MPLFFCALFAYLYISSSVFFDIVHYFFHQWSTSQWKALQWLSRCHQYHHLYYNRSLTFNRRYQLQNAWIALPLEMACLVIGGLLGWSLLHLMTPNAKDLDRTPLIVVLAVHLVRTLVVICMSGRDSNHIAYKTVPKDPHWLFVGPQFHALHHLDPDRYMSSVVKLFDWAAGTAYTLRNKNVAITGGSGAFGTAIQQQLRSEGVRHIRALKFGTHWTHHDFSRVGSALDEADILILAHGTKGPDAMEANCGSTIRLIELFMERRGRRQGRTAKTLPEIWYVGSESELHPAFGGPAMRRYAASKRAFVPYARALYDHPQIVYRHIVPAAFDSPMGKAVVSAEWAASVAMWWIRRGACYVPVSYTGIAYLNFLKFVCWVRPDLDRVARI
jgi:NAD(P)-dependent dehydrogenase (short-subunit alcohol dehydrogenase family)